MRMNAHRRSSSIAFRRRPTTSTRLTPPTEAALRILDVVRRIPPGRVATYGQVAALAGLPRRARLVGRILRVEPLADLTPWHRVVNAAGRISERDGSGPRLQRDRLRLEGVEIAPSGRIALRRFQWRPRRRAATRLKSTGRRRIHVVS